MGDLRTFESWPKTPRLGGAKMLITEKIDGTNAQIVIVPHPPEDGEMHPVHEAAVWYNSQFSVFAGSRTRYVVPGDDNFGFAAWVKEHAEELLALGAGRHYGEWYGAGIQRRYGLDHKRFALFWSHPVTPACCETVPTLYWGNFSLDKIAEVHAELLAGGSRAVPGWGKPEGIVVELKGFTGRHKITDLPKGGK